VEAELFSYEKGAFTGAFTSARDRRHQHRVGSGGPRRPPIVKDVEDPIVRMTKENRSWGYDRIAGALANLRHEVSDQTVGNVLRRRWHAAGCWSASTTPVLSSRQAPPFLSCSVWTAPALTNYGGAAARMRI
jgi:hypothetical protein